MVVVKIAVLHSNCRLLDVIANLVTVNHKLVVAATFVFPEELTTTIKVFGNGSLDALVYLAWANCIEVFAVIGEEPSNNQGEHEEETANYLEDGIRTTFAK